MRKLILLLIVVTLSSALHSQGNFIIKDANTLELMQDTSVVLSYSLNFTEVFHHERDINNSFKEVKEPDRLNCCKQLNITRNGQFRLNYDIEGCMRTIGFYMFNFTCKVNIEISASGYETTTISDQGRYGGDSPGILERDHLIYLIPKKENVNLDGKLDVNQTTNQAYNQVSTLNVLSAKQIANQLGVSEAAINDLIIKQKLKGKKIGEQYFVRKEDFDAYMKQ